MQRSRQHNTQTLNTASLNKSSQRGLGDRTDSPSAPSAGCHGHLSSTTALTTESSNTLPMHSDVSWQSAAFALDPSLEPDPDWSFDFDVASLHNNTRDPPSTTLTGDVEVPEFSQQLSQGQNVGTYTAGCPAQISTCLTNRVCRKCSRSVRTPCLLRVSFGTLFHQDLVTTYCASSVVARATPRGCGASLLIRQSHATGCECPSAGSKESHTHISRCQPAWP